MLLLIYVLIIIIILFLLYKIINFSEEREGFKCCRSPMNIDNFNQCISIAPNGDFCDNKANCENSCNGKWFDNVNNIYCNKLVDSYSAGICARDSLENGTINDINNTNPVLLKKQQILSSCKAATC